MALTTASAGPFILLPYHGDVSRQLVTLLVAAHVLCAIWFMNESLVDMYTTPLSPCCQSLGECQ